MLLLVGLGNCGQKYSQTRHNLGFMAIDEIAHTHGFTTWRRKFEGMCASGKINTQDVLLLKPTTFVNESGRSIKAAMRFYKLLPQNIIVFYDEIDLAPGKIRLRVGGNTAGHNGIGSIITHIGNEFRRVRIGIGRPPAGTDRAQYVLRKFAARDNLWRIPMLTAIAIHAPLLAEDHDARFQTHVIETVRDAMIGNA